MQARAAAIDAQGCFTPTEVQVQGQVGIVQVDRGAGAPLLALQIYQGIFDLQGAVVAVVEARGAAGGIDPEAGTRR